MFCQETKIRNSPIEGVGCFATKYIPKGSIVWKLDPREKRFTLEELLSQPPERQKLAYQAGDRYIIVTDGSEVTNHSCNPNLWFEGDEAFSARRDILPGEELTYDYSTSDINPKIMPDMLCRCGSAICREIITYKDSLNLKLQETYKGHMPSWILNFIKHNPAKT